MRNWTNPITIRVYMRLKRRIWSEENRERDTKNKTLWREKNRERVNFLRRKRWQEKRR